MNPNSKSNAFVHKGKIYKQFTSLHRDRSALKFLTLEQSLILLLLVALTAFLIWWNLYSFLTAAAAFLTVLYFADLLFHLFVITKSLVKRVGVVITKEELAKHHTHDWPLYTILCPLYNESRVLPQFVKAINKLDYPKDKLQVILLLEEGDAKTIATARRSTHGQHFQIVIVPQSLPQTKPKACNYGMHLSSGKYSVIFDAEDIPEPDQLKKAVLAFESSPENVQCIQAKLAFYNTEQNWLTRFFTLEYSLWFNLVMTGYQAINAPMPLGGTSNHFRTKFLQKIKGWDAFNVTEDCDLGIRLAVHGYKTVILETYTYEEANSSLANWLNQRSR